MPLPARIDLTTLAADQGFIIQGGAPYDRAGDRALSAGTVTNRGATARSDTDTATITVATLNHAPTQSGLAGDTATFTEEGQPIRLDVAGDAAIADPDPYGFEVERVASGLSGGGPVFITEIPDGTGRLFVVEKFGAVRILNPATGTFAASPFLDLTGQLATGGEQGLLGLALAPDYATSGTFYVYLTNTSGDNEIRRYQRDASNPDLANAASGDRILLSPHPTNTNHNGGWIGFGQDGFLYIASGDGAVSSNAQSLNTLLGKILRIDPSSDAFAADPDRDYAIPVSNPFAGATPGLDEIFASGLRNPFRASFDPLNGDLYIGDVGQNAIEEVDLIPAGVGGLNFGWDLREGTAQFGGPNQAGFTAPVIQYGHGSGPRQGNSITGGLVYRGPIAGLDGHYVFGDFFNKLWSVPEPSLVQGSTVPSSAFALRNTAFTANAGSVGQITSFATDAAGNLYVTDLAGEIFQVRASSAPNFAGGQLRVAISANKIAGEDVLGFAPGGTVTGSSGTAVGSVISVGGIAIGAIAPTGTGSGADDLVVLLSSGANAARISTLLQFLTYANTNTAAPSTATRTITYTLDDGAGTQNGGTNLLVFTSNVAVAGVDDVPVAVANSASTPENATISIAVLANDTDVDGGPKNVIQIAGVAAMAGTAITLASNATATLNANGTITYDPNGRFDTLTDGTSGAVNTSGQDSFTYTLNGNSATTVTVAIAGVAGPGDVLRGSAGNNTITGTASADLFVFSQGAGGTDSATGGDGGDGFYFGATLDASDSANGGAGADDQVGIRGNYVIAIGATTLLDIETIVLFSGGDARFEAAGGPASYNITTVDGNVAAGERLVVNGALLLAGESFTFSGASETNGSFTFFGGMGTEDLTGGARSDGFFFGDDRYDPALDKIDGVSGTDDQLGLRGNFGTIAFAADAMANIDSIVLISSANLSFGGGAGVDFDYDLILNDGNAVGGALTVTGIGLESDEDLKVDGSAEDDSILSLRGGFGNDILIGGQLGDILFGNIGADTLTGGLGADKFLYHAVSQSTDTVRDLIVDFTGDDVIDLIVIDAIGGAGLPNEAFIFTGSTVNTAAGSLYFQDNGNGSYTFFAHIDGDGVADLVLDVNAGIGYAWSAADFVL